MEATQIVIAIITLPLLAKARALRNGTSALAFASLAISLVGAYLLVDRSLLAQL